MSNGLLGLVWGNRGASEIGDRGCEFRLDRRYRFCRRKVDFAYFVRGGIVGMSRMGFLPDRTVAPPIAATTTSPTTSALAPIAALVMAPVDDLGRLLRLVVSLLFTRLLAVNRHHAGSLGERARRGSF